MSDNAVDVEPDHGRVWARGTVPLPTKAHALLPVLEPNGDTSAPATSATGTGLQRFLSPPDFGLTPEQFRASMEADFPER